MIQPTRVLPSNASPTRDNENVHEASRVLQEHSGNRQQIEICFGDDYEQKYPSSVLTENSYSIVNQRQYPQTQAPQLYHPQPHHRQTWRYGLARGGHRHPAPEVEANIRFDTERLYNRFRKSDQFVKYRNRQTKEDKGNGEQKWPEHLERAFFRALVQWPPMGRRKTFWKEKQRGRNELIADCLHELTGETRTRKQVSSHIQVLKPFVENDPHIMKWLSKDDMGHQAGRYHGSTAYTNGRRMSNYPVNIPPPTAQVTLRNLSRPDMHALQRVKGDLSIFEPSDFQMFVQRNYKVSKEYEDVQRLHTYTESTTNPRAPDLHLEDSLALLRDFPLLAAMQAQRPLDCSILDAKASLAFPTMTWKEDDGSPTPGVELGIYFLCTSRHLPPAPLIPTVRDKAYQIIVHNHFYENGAHIKDHSGPSEARLEPSERGDSVETRIKFGSTFWAKTLGRLAGRLLDASRNHEEEVASYLRTINAVQEIHVWSESGPESLLIIHWNFRLSSSSKGRASWRKVILPGQLSQYIVSNETDKVDSQYEYTQVPDASTSQQQHVPSELTLHSPFEYESSSGSTMFSATWPSSLRDVDGLIQQNGSAEFYMDNAFDFNAGTINFAYDPSLSFDNFDSSAFNFDTTAADLTVDSDLQNYSQHWYDGYANNFGVHQAIGGTDSFATQSNLCGQAPALDDYNNEIDQHVYAATADVQAYVGAEQGRNIIKDDDALAALADVSFIASTLGSY